MKIFLDTADTQQIRERFETGLIDGVTTNPTLIRKSGRDPEEVYQEIRNIGLQDISMEVAGSTFDMVSEGVRLKTIFGHTATIKVPCTPDGLRACKQLRSELIKVNVTLIFDAAQAILAAKAGAAYVSPFVGRLDDNSAEGLNLIEEIHEIYDMQYINETKILAASIRDVKSVSHAFQKGAGVVTMPPAVFDKMYNHILTDKGLEIFENDLAVTNENFTGSSI